MGCYGSYFVAGMDAYHTPGQTATPASAALAARTQSFPYGAGSLGGRPSVPFSSSR